MAAEPRRLDYWRKYLRSANGGIFDVIEHAILVAASDCPKEFLVQRDRIAETLFSCQLARCHGCDKVKQQFSPEEEEEDDLEEPGREGDGVAVGVEKDRKFSSMDDAEEVGANRMVSNYSYDEAEALTEEMEEESQMIGEVLRIKEIVANQDDEPDSLLFESLRRLQLMAISVETLKWVEGDGR
ncbi:hypothetical protein Taro_018751 [Colocasia esculenta]|uniref:Uncharacterized protein n=1 Tax=Colocasia esculenta TaxID=4460 RepID=A0A843URJ8_COLES|nr:hypothetical protein [Colocasia esculenta]